MAGWRWSCVGVLEAAQLRVRLVGEASSQPEQLLLPENKSGAFCNESAKQAVLGIQGVALPGLLPVPQTFGHNNDLDWDYS